MSGPAPASPPAPRGRIGAWIFAAVFLLVALYVLRNIDRGWLPHDEGTLAQPAARVLLEGQLPHRDFDDMYTGGQALYHAAVFRLLGTRLVSLRAALFVAFLATLPLLWYLATRFAGYAPAAVTVVLAAAWCIPAYPAAMPSWYNLFLAVGAVAACARYLETRRRRWWTTAGICAGLSITVKVAGFYLLAALLLFLVYDEQEEARRLGAAEGTASRGWVYSGLVTLGLVAFAGMVATLVRSLATPATVLHFVLPPAALAGVLLWREWFQVPAADGRALRLLGSGAALLAGVGIPVAAFLTPYVLTGSVGDLLHGVFVLPARRFSMAIRPPSGPLSFLPLVGLVALAAWAARSRRRELVAVAAVSAPLVAGLVLGNRPPVYRAAWWLILPLIPVLVLAGSALLAFSGSARGEVGSDRSAGRGPVGGGDERARAARSHSASLFFLLLAATALVSLVQFPTSAPVYFFYAAPLTAVLGLGVVSRLPRPPWALAGTVAAFHILFAVTWIHPGWIYQMGDYFAAHPPTERLRLERGGLRLVPSERLEMEGLVDLLDRVAPGRTIWVTPDAPEVYFLSGRRNPTRTLFDFFEESGGRRERILSMLERANVGAVVYNTGPARFSSLPSIDLQREIAALYPQFTTVGRFLVRWRGSEHEDAR